MWIQKCIMEFHMCNGNYKEKRPEHKTTFTTAFFLTDGYRWVSILILVDPSKETWTKLLQVANASLHDFRQLPQLDKGPLQEFILSLFRLIDPLAACAFELGKDFCHGWGNYSWREGHNKKQWLLLYCSLVSFAWACEPRVMLRLFWVRRSSIMYDVS